MKIQRFQDDYLGIFTASYLIETANYNVWIDGGLLIGKDAKLPYYQNGKKNVLILTHGHWDHIGMSSYTQSVGGEVYIHSGDVPMITNHEWLWDMLFGQFENDFDLPAARKSMFWSCVGENILPDHLLKDQDILAFDDISLEVIHTPGHSPGSVCLYEKNEKILFAGDSIIGNGFFAGSPQLADFDDYIRSMKKLAQWQPSEVLTAHTPVKHLDEYKAWLDEGIECAERMLKAVKDFASTSDSEFTVGALAKVIAQEEGKGVGGGTCVTALNALKCMHDDSRTDKVISRYIYGY